MFHCGSSVLCGEAECIPNLPKRGQHGVTVFPYFLQLLKLVPSLGVCKRKEIPNTSSEVYFVVTYV